MVLERGYIQIYTGNGKGKTTASTGIALRMLAAGGKVFLGRFMKSGDSGELSCLSRWDSFSFEHFGGKNFIFGTPKPEDVALAQSGLARAAEVLKGGAYDMVVLDEILNAILFKLIAEDEVLDILPLKAPCTELILTGRNASEALIAKADLVTEMREIKHYYQQGVHSRIGIEE